MNAPLCSSHYVWLLRYENNWSSHQWMNRWRSICVSTQSFSCILLFVTQWTIAHQSSVHGIFQARILEWVTISYSRGSAQPRDQTQVSCAAGGFFTIKPPGKPMRAGVVVQSPNRARLFATPWTAAHQVSLPLTISQSLTKFMSLESVMPSNHLILWHPLLLLSIFPSIGVFSNESAVHIRPKVAKVLELQLQLQSFQKYLGFISFKIDWKPVAT